MSDYSLRSESQAREKERKKTEMKKAQKEKKIDIILQLTPCAT